MNDLRDSQTTESISISSETIKERLISAVIANIFIQPLIMALGLVSSVIVARILGPELLAIIATLTATSTTIIAFSDLGIARSMPKLLQDASVKFGYNATLQLQHKLIKVKIITTCSLLAGLLVLHLNGVKISSLSLSSNIWFLSLVIIKSILGSTILIQRSASFSAFKSKELALLTLAITLLNPALLIAVAFLFHNPYAVFGMSLIEDFFQIFIMRKFIHYDLDKEKQIKNKISNKWLINNYWKYISVTYLEFIFNRFIYGLPITLIFLSLYGTTATIIGNISIATSMVLRAWDVANLPLMNLRAPLLARLHAEKDAEKFARSQSLMIAIVILTSGTLAIITASMGPKIFFLLYGKEYNYGVYWGIVATVIALIANFFTLGNNALHQTNRFLPELIGLIVSGGYIILNGTLIVKLVEPQVAPLIILLGFIIARALFWLLTDIWADFKLFNWNGTILKIKALIAAIITLIIIIYLNKLNFGLPLQIIISLIEAILFLLLFRIFGGVGENIRKTAVSLIPQKYSFLYKFLKLI